MILKNRPRDLRQIILIGALLYLGSLGVGCSSDSAGGDPSAPEDVQDSSGDMADTDDVIDAPDMSDPAEVEELVLSPDPVEISVGESVQVHYTAHGAGGQEVEQAPVNWRMEDDEVAAVDETGLVQGISPGDTTLIATSGPAQASLAVLVLPSDEIARLEIAPQTREIGVGERLALSVNAYRADDTQLPLQDLEVDWRSSSPDIATLDADGTLRGIKRGEVEVQVDVADIQATATFRVELKFSSITCSNTSCYAISSGGKAYKVRLNRGAENSEGVSMPIIERVEVDEDIHFKSAHSHDFRSNCLLSTDGRVYCWGQNTLGSLGADYGTTDLDAPTLLETDLRFESLAMGQFSTCGLTPEGALYCWGDLLISGKWASRGLDFDETHSTEPVLIDPGPFGEISMLAASLCAQDIKAQTWRCMGDGQYGQLGNGELIDRDELISLAPPGAFATLSGQGSSASHRPRKRCGVDRERHIWCWGASKPAPERTAWDIEMIDVQQVDDGFCGVTAEGDIRCWGILTICSAGYSSTLPSRSHPYDEPQPAIESVPEDIKSLSSRCMLTEGGDIWCWALTRLSADPMLPHLCEPSAQRLLTF